MTNFCQISEVLDFKIWWNKKWRVENREVAYIAGGRVLEGIIVQLVKSIAWEETSPLAVSDI